MEIGVDAAEQLGICRLDDGYPMKWRSGRYLFAITQVRGVLYVDGNTLLAPWTANFSYNEPAIRCL